MNASSPLKLPHGLYALCDDSIRPELSLEEKAARLLEGGVRVMQLRMKRTPVREAVRAARAVVSLCRSAGAVCLINDRVDWALLSGAHGVHVGDEDLPPEDARALLGPDRLVGATVRDLAGAQRAKAAGADYAGLGPVFPTGTKVVNAPPLGLEALAQIASRSPLPLVAISGIRLDNVEAVAATGVHGAAVASDLLAAPDVAEQARRLVQAFERGRGRRSLPGPV